MLKAIKIILMSAAIILFLTIIFSIGAVGFVVYVAILLGWFINAMNRNLKKRGL